MHNSAADSKVAAEAQAYHALRDRDVICGKRGNSHCKHPGNVHFLQFVRANLAEYIKGGSRIDRTLVVIDVLDSLRSNDIKFLKKDLNTNQYIELTTEQAHSKIGHAIRDQIKQLGLGDRCRSTSSLPSKVSKKASAGKKKKQRRHSDAGIHKSKNEAILRTSVLPVGNFDPIGSWSPSSEETCPSGLQTASLEQGRARAASKDKDTSELSNMLFDLGDNVEDLDLFAPLQNLVSGFDESVARLQTTHLGSQRGLRETHQTTSPAYQNVDQTRSSSLFLTPLPLNSESHLQADDMDVVRDILERR